VYLWGPTLVALALGASTAATARIFTMIAVAGIVGKIAFSLLSRFIGRRRTNEIGCFGGSIALCAAGILHHEFVGGMPVLVMMLVLGAFFFDGVVANLAPYTVEIYPTRLAARGYSLGQAANGAAKLFAPLALAALAGVGLQVTASATAASLVPSFIFMGGCVLLSGVSSLLIPIDAPECPEGSGRSRRA
jgi:putative MFS transporter